MDLPLGNLWTLAATLLSGAIAMFAAGHTLLTKRDERATVAWVGLILLLPIIGSLLYFLFGINRIHRRARVLRGQHVTPMELEKRAASEMRRVPTVPSAGSWTPHVPPAGMSAGLATLGQKLFAADYLDGNALIPLANGDTAYPAMLEAIRSAQHSIALSTYIFNRDEAGLAFVDALADAVARGVEVRVLIDGVGSHYSMPPVVAELRRRRVTVARFLYSLWPWRMPYLNMRNHQKILVVDGKLGFTGGMNIAVGNLHASNPKRRIADTHFQVQGPVVGQLMQLFAHEWEFATSEELQGAAWFPTLEPAGQQIVRAIAAGPDQDTNPIRWTLLGALAEARHEIRIVTPYFLPDAALETGLRLAALRGVAVDIVMPEANNLPFVKWAANAQLEPLIDAGCRIYFAQGPFDHSKLMIVDGAWSMVGSANWDPRSLRLNFELNLECYGAEFADELDRRIGSRIDTARRLTRSALDRRPLVFKLRDAAIRLLSPYL